MINLDRLALIDEGLESSIILYEAVHGTYSARASLQVVKSCLRVMALASIEGCGNLDGVRLEYLMGLLRKNHVDFILSEEDADLLLELGRQLESELTVVSEEVSCKCIGLVQTLRTHVEELLTSDVFLIAMSDFDRAACTMWYGTQALLDGNFYKAVTDNCKAFNLLIRHVISPRVSLDVSLNEGLKLVAASAPVIKLLPGDESFIVSCMNGDFAYSEEVAHECARITELFRVLILVWINSESLRASVNRMDLFEDDGEDK